MDAWTILNNGPHKHFDNYVNKTLHMERENHFRKCQLFLESHELCILIFRAVNVSEI